MKQLQKENQELQEQLEDTKRQVSVLTRELQNATSGVKKFVSEAQQIQGNNRQRDPFAPQYPGYGQSGDQYENY